MADNGDKDRAVGSEGEDGGDESAGEVVMREEPTLRPVFLGNLNPGYKVEQVKEIFEKPIQPPNASQDYEPFPVDRVDLKRGFCFIFLKDPASHEEKERAETFVSEISGMDIPGLTKALRVEYARGDGKVKRKEDERRKSITPCATLFVVNFHENTTKKDDLRMLFEPFGRLVRIEMKDNFAFVEFETIEEATRARDATNGGKIDQSVLTVEYAASKRDNAGGGGGGGGGGGEGRNRRRRRDRGGGGGGRRDDRRRGPPPPPNDRYDDRGRYDRDRYDDRYRSRRDSPPTYYRGGGSRPRSRSRSPRSPGYRSRSPPRRYDDRYDDRYNDYRRGGGGGGGGSPSPDRDRYGGGYRDRRSPDRDGRGDRDRGYR